MISAAFEFPQSPLLLQTIEAVGFQAGRYCPALGLHLDLKARLNTLLEIDRFLQPQSERVNGRRSNEYEERIWACNSDSERADAVAFVARRTALIGELYDHISDVRAWLLRLDSNSTIDHRPSWAFEFRRYQRRWPVARLMDHFGYARLPAVPDVWSKMLADGALSARRSEYMSRLDIEIAQAVEAGWFVVMDTLTIGESKEDAFFEDPNVFRDHVRRVGRLVNVACGRKAGVPFDDVFRYFAVPEYGKQKGRLHFHVIYFMKRLPRHSVDPNIGMRVPRRREVATLKIWQYGFSSPLAVRFSGDAFTAAGWAWPVDKMDRPLVCKPPIAVARYVSKYVNKSFVERVEWLKTNGLMRSKLFRVRMSRNFGLRLDLSTLSLQGLWEVSCLHVSVTRSARLLRRLALRQMSLRLAGLAIADFLGLMPPRMSFLERLRGLTAKSPTRRPPSFIDSMILRLRAPDISDEVRRFLRSVPCLEKGRVPVSGK